MKRLHTTSVLMTALLLAPAVMAEGEPESGGAVSDVAWCARQPIPIEPGDDESFVSPRRLNEGYDLGFGSLSTSLGAPGLAEAWAMSIEMASIPLQTPDALVRSRFAEPGAWSEHIPESLNVSTLGDLDVRVGDSQVSEGVIWVQEYLDRRPLRLHEDVGDPS